MTALAIPDAASELGVSVPTLRRWVAAGCPVARRGGRGRGRATLVVPDAVRAWRAGGADAVLLAVAGRVPELLGEAAAEAHRLADGLDKKRLAGILAGCWYLGATAVLDHMRDICPNVPDVGCLPEEVQRLRKISGQ